MHIWISILDFSFSLLFFFVCFKQKAVYIEITVEYTYHRKIKNLKQKKSKICRLCDGCA